jgi:hypothetical protein
LIAAAALAGCVTIRYEDIQLGELKGRVLVQWVSQDKFVYRKTSEPLSFKPTFMHTAIVPDEMFTDGGSVPRMFWNIPGLSPWALGPAYIMHDWLFEVHRCGRNVPPEVASITFEQSALVLAQVGKALIETGLVNDNLLEEIVWAVRTRYARDLWDRPGTEKECERPAALVRGKALVAGGRTVADFRIPPYRRR